MQPTLSGVTQIGLCFTFALLLQGCWKKNTFQCDLMTNKWISCDSDNPDWCRSKRVECTKTQFGCGNDLENSADKNQGWIVEGNNRQCCPATLFKCSGKDDKFCQELTNDKVCKDKVPGDNDGEKPDAAKEATVNNQTNNNPEQAPTDNGAQNQAPTDNKESSSLIEKAKISTAMQKEKAEKLEERVTLSISSFIKARKKSSTGSLTPNPGFLSHDRNRSLPSPDADADVPKERSS